MKGTDNTQWLSSAEGEHTYARHLQRRGQVKGVNTQWLSSAEGEHTYARPFRGIEARPSEGRQHAVAFLR